MLNPLGRLNTGCDFFFIKSWRMHCKVRIINVSKQGMKVIPVLFSNNILVIDNSAYSICNCDI